MKAIIEFTEDQLEYLKNLNLFNIVCTEKDAVILSPLTDQYILEEIDYVLDWKQDGEKSQYYADLWTDQQLRSDLLKDVKKEMTSMIKHGENPNDDDLHDYIERFMDSNQKEYDKKRKEPTR